MRIQIGLLVGVFAFSMAGVSPISAQGTSAGARDSEGRILTKVVVTLSRPNAYGTPVSNLTFLVIAPDGDRVSIRTNDAGVASTWLFPGNYRLVTPDAFNWQGHSYTWDQMLLVTSRTPVLQLTQTESNTREAATTARASAGHPSATEVSSDRVITPWNGTLSPRQVISVSEPDTSNPVTYQSAPHAALGETAQRTNDNEPINPARSRIRSGFWFNLGSGYGAITCETCSSTLNGYSGGLSLGGTLSPRVQLGIGTTGWYRSENGASLTTGTVDARIRFFPSATSGFFLTGGIGAGSIGASLAGYGSGTEFGMGSVLGMGWDLDIAPGVSLSPFWNAFNVKTADTNTTVGQIGLGFTFH
jgi:hypothetical protein